MVGRASGEGRGSSGGAGANANSAARQRADQHTRLLLQLARGICLLTLLPLIALTLMPRPPVVDEQDTRGDDSSPAADAVLPPPRVVAEDSSQLPELPVVLQQVLGWSWLPFAVLALAAGQLSSSSGSDTGPVSGSAPTVGWRQRVASLSGGLIGVFLGAPLFFALAVLFGAPLERELDLTWWWALHAASLSSGLVGSVLRLEPSRWHRVFAQRQHRHPLEVAVFCAVTGTLVGAWLSSAPLPLDWRQDWQVCSLHGVCAWRLVFMHPFIFFYFPLTSVVFLPHHAHELGTAVAHAKRLWSASRPHWRRNRGAAAASKGQDAPYKAGVVDIEPEFLLCAGCCGLGAAGFRPRADAGEGLVVDNLQYLRQRVLAALGHAHIHSKHLSLGCRDGRGEREERGAVAARYSTIPHKTSGSSPSSLSLPPPYKATYVAGRVNAVWMLDGVTNHHALGIEPGVGMLGRGQSKSIHSSLPFPHLLLRLTFRGPAPARRSDIRSRRRGRSGATTPGRAGRAGTRGWRRLRRGR